MTALINPLKLNTSKISVKIIVFKDKSNLYNSKPYDNI